MKNVQISYDLFIKLLQYYHFEKYEYEEEIKQELEKKLNAMVMREHYTNYKTAPTEEEKDAVGVNSLRMLEKGSDKLSDPDVK